MDSQLSDPEFWDGNTDYQKLAHAFTSQYAATAWRLAAVPPASHVLDIACGAGALALVAARDGARVLATDFSPGMVAAVAAHGLPDLEARVMDGQALDLPDAAFDAAFSMFGIMLFPDWRKGLAEMARVVRPGGIGCLGTWKAAAGAATNLLIATQVAALFPDIVPAATIGGMAEWRTPEGFRAAMTIAGFTDVTVTEISHEFRLDAAALAEPDRVTQFSPAWLSLDDPQRDVVLASIRAIVAAAGGVLPIASPALIAVARRL